MAYIVEREFKHAGYKCVVTFGDIGYRCGYVGVPKGSKLYGKNCEKLDFDVHGGLTYSGGGKNSDYPIKSDLWWLGFDCAHGGDRADNERVMELFPDKAELHKGYMRISKEVDKRYGFKVNAVRLEGYVVNECKRLARQIYVTNIHNVRR